MLQSGAAQQDLKDASPQFQPSLFHSYIVLTDSQELITQMERSVQKLLYIFFTPRTIHHFFFFVRLCCLAIFALKMTLPDKSKIDRRWSEKRNYRHYLLWTQTPEIHGYLKVFSYHAVRDHRTPIWKEKHFCVTANMQRSFDCEMIMCTLSDSHQLFCK